MRLVIDTSVLVASIHSRNGASNALIRSAAMGHCRLLVSVPLFLEYEAVITRPEHLAAANLPLADALGFLDYLANFMIPVRIDYLWRPSLVDPADEMVLEAAINGRAEGIVTSNLRHFTPAAAHGIRVMYPGDALRRLS